MNVKLKLYATLSEYLPAGASRANEVALSVPGEATVGELIEKYNLPHKLVYLVLLNGHFVPPAAREARVLSEGDVLAMWPPIAGG